MQVSKFLGLAAKYAISHTINKDKRCFWLGAVAVRSDGTVVHARNGSSYHRCPKAHCEVRLMRKVDVGAIVFVARVLRDGSLAQAKPCHNCQSSLRNFGVQEVYYTIQKDIYGRIIL